MFAQAHGFPVGVPIIKLDSLRKTQHLPSWKENSVIVVNKFKSLIAMLVLALLFLTSGCATMRDHFDSMYAGGISSSCSSSGGG
ncbi:MAG: hypothetical protein ACI87E_004949 [Mariniblastus sp.]